MLKQTPQDEIGEIIFDLITYIENLNKPLTSDKNFPDDLSTGAVKYLDTHGTSRVFKIRLITDVLEIREDGRDVIAHISNIRLTIGQNEVFQGQIKFSLEDENEWLYEGGEISVFKPGPWVNEIRLTINRLDLLLESRNAEYLAQREFKAQSKLSKRILERRSKEKSEGEK